MSGKGWSATQFNIRLSNLINMNSERKQMMMHAVVRFLFADGRLSFTPFACPLTTGHNPNELLQIKCVFCGADTIFFGLWNDFGVRQMQEHVVAARKGLIRRQRQLLVQFQWWLGWHIIHEDRRFVVWMVYRMLYAQLYEWQRPTHFNEKCNRKQSKAVEWFVLNRLVSLESSRWLSCLLPSTNGLEPNTIDVVHTAHIGPRMGSNRK